MQYFYMSKSFFQQPIYFSDTEFSNCEQEKSLLSQQNEKINRKVFYNPDDMAAISR